MRIADFSGIIMNPEQGGSTGHTSKPPLLKWENLCCTLNYLQTVKNTDT
jgi:hypothetical protein